MQQQKENKNSLSIAFSKALKGFGTTRFAQLVGICFGPEPGEKITKISEDKGIAL